MRAIAAGAARGDERGRTTIMPTMTTSAVADMPMKVVE